MPITFPCPCGLSLEVDEQHAGSTVECPTCHRLAFVPSPKRRATVVENKAPPPPPLRGKSHSDDDDDDVPPSRRKRKRRHHGDDDESPRTRRLMAQAHARLDEEEDRYRREGGRFNFSPGMIGGLIAFGLGTLGAIFFILFFPWIRAIVICAVVAIVGLVRAILSFMGQEVD